MKKIQILTITLLVSLLAACGSYDDGSIIDTANPPEGSFSMTVNPSKLELVKGDTTGTVITVEVGFDSSYEHEVRLSANSPTPGVSVFFANEELDTLELKQAGQIELRVVASADAETLNPYLEIIAQGVNAKGRTRGLARLQKTLDVSIR